MNVNRLDFTLRLAADRSYPSYIAGKTQTRHTASIGHNNLPITRRRIG